MDQQSSRNESLVQLVADYGRVMAMYGESAPWPQAARNQMVENARNVARALLYAVLDREPTMAEVSVVIPTLPTARKNAHRNST